MGRAPTRLRLCDSSRQCTSLISPQDAQLPLQKRVSSLTHLVLQTHPLKFYQILLGHPERHTVRKNTPRISSSDHTQHHQQEEVKITTSSSYSILAGCQCVSQAGSCSGGSLSQLGVYFYGIIEFFCLSANTQPSFLINGNCYVEMWLNCLYHY